MTERSTDGRDEAAVRQFIEHVAMTFADLGFPRMAARVLFVIMCAEEDALTAAEGGAGGPPATVTASLATPGTR